ncbi:MAG TPA: TlpA disulfide reductase family protein [Terracidiphilus sp.]|nr:TlpA disulfide reductase family protein [Terracidiphilus sp.]
MSCKSAHLISAFLFASTFTAVPLLHANDAARIKGELDGLRSLSEQKRPEATIDICKEIAALPPGKDKVKFADQASNLVTEGDQGHDALQTVADTLSKALEESPVPAKGDQPPMPYLDLARLARYEDVTVSLKDPLYQKALDSLASNDADVAKADFTLKDLNRKPWTLSQLRGKIVMVNFWATWCPPCRVEMPVLDAIYTHYQNEGLVVLSITDETPLTVVPFLTGKSYHPPILIDDGGKVHKEFHIVGIPKTYVFDRDGKLVGETIDQSTQKQFFALLGKAGLKPE